MDRMLHRVLAASIRTGTLRVTTARGAAFTVGNGTGQPIAVRFMTREAQLGVLLDPDLKLGEAYMNGTLVIEDGSIADLLALVFSQDCSGNPPRWTSPQWVLRYLHRRLQQFNERNRARKNVAHHYDLSAKLYSLFLDADRQYSCAYFETPDQALDEAQLAKKRHLAAAPSEFWEAIGRAPSAFLHLNLLASLTNLLWVTLGNMIGGMLVGIIYWFIYLRRVEPRTLNTQ